MAILLKEPVPHPTQSGIMLTNYALEELHLVNGSAIDKAASLDIVLRPFAPFVSNGITGYLSPVDFKPFTMSIPNVYAWVAQRIASGDSTPQTALGYLLLAAGQEYSRR